eukprot:152050_1
MSLICNYFFFFIFTLTNTMTSEILTPLHQHSNGINITTKEVTTNLNNEWNVTIQSQKTFQFIISLDRTWGFNPNTQSSIRITISSPSIADTLSFDDLVFGFATNNQQYFSVWIPMDNNGQKNRIYPSCDTSSVPSQTFASGDITKLLHKDRACDIAGSSCNNWNTMRPKNAQYPNVYQYNGFPITFTLENNPIANTFYMYFDTALFSASFVQKCGFVALPSDEGLTIYIGGNGDGQTFLISSFEIESFLNESSIVDDSAEIDTPVATNVNALVPSGLNDENADDTIDNQNSVVQHASAINMIVIAGAIAVLFAVCVSGVCLCVKWCSGNAKKNKVASEVEQGGIVAGDALNHTYMEEGVTEENAVTEGDVRWHNLNSMVTHGQGDVIQDIVDQQEPLPPTYHYQ